MHFLCHFHLTGPSSASRLSLRTAHTACPVSVREYRLAEPVILAAGLKGR